MAVLADDQRDTAEKAESEERHRLTYVSHEHRPHRSAAALRHAARGEASPRGGEPPRDRPGVPPADVRSLDPTLSNRRARRPVAADLRSLHGFAAQRCRDFGTLPSLRHAVTEDARAARGLRGRSAARSARACAVDNPRGGPAVRHGAGDRPRPRSCARAQAASRRCPREALVHRLAGPARLSLTSARASCARRTAAGTRR